MNFKIFDRDNAPVEPNWAINTLDCAVEYCEKMGLRLFVNDIKEVDWCPICGQTTAIYDKTKNGRFIGKCGDAFTGKQWDKD